MRFYVYLVLFISSLNLNAAKLNIDSSIETSFKSFSNLIYGNKNYNLSYFTSNLNISFALKDSVLEKTLDSKSDMLISIRAFNINSDSKTLNSPYIKNIADFYDNYNIFIDEAYIKIKSDTDNELQMISGRFHYTLSNGLVLSDNLKGFDGFKIDIKNRFFSDMIEIFYFRKNFISAHNIYGLVFNKSFFENSLWQLYILKNTSKDINTPIFSYKKTDNIYSGISYSIKTNEISYSFEFVKEGGESKTSIKELTNDSYALNINSSWYSKLPVIGRVKTKASYTNSSGGFTQKKDKTFFSAFSKRYNGFEYNNYGSIIESSPWSVAPASNTVSGVWGASGFIKVNAGIEMPFKKSYLSFDISRYKANHSSSASKDIGTEYIFKLKRNLSDKTNITLNYSIFKPSDLIKTSPNIKSTSLVSLSIKSEF